MDPQKDAITRAVRARGLRVDVWYAEKIGGGRGVVRAELNRARADARAGKLTHLFVFRLDRLSRGGILEVLNIVHELREHGCKLDSIADGFSLEGPAGDVILAVFAWVAEMERSAIRVRLADARRTLESKGGHWGRPRKTSPLDEQRIHALKAKGRSVRKIAMAVKIPRSTVGRVLSQKNPPKRSGKNPPKSGLQPS